MSGKSGLEGLAVGIKYGLYKNRRYADMCIESDILKVKVPIIFFGTQGFSARRDGRYYLRD